MAHETLRVWRVAGVPKHRYLRTGDTLDDDEIVIVRGGALDPRLLRDDARRNYEIYGVYGVSVFAVRDVTVDEMAQHAPFVRFDVLTLMTVAVLHRAGLTLEATGRNSRHFDITFFDLDDGISRLCACEHRTFDNPYYEQ